MDQKALINKEDLAKALRSYLGSQNVPEFDFEVSKGTEKVEGFLSLVMRVIVKFVRDGGKEEELSLIVKRLPVSELQQQYTKGSDFYQRESDFFNVAQPILLKNTRNPKQYPIVTCYFASESVVILEDLSVSGHRIVSKTLSNHNYCSMDLQFIDLILRKSAIMHSASLGTDWTQVMPKLKEDCLFTGHGRKLMYTRITNGARFVKEVLKSEYPEAHSRHGEWMVSEKCYDTLKEFAMPSKTMRNVLCHGDLWENNALFLLDELNQPYDLKLIDLQMARLCPIAVELQFFLHLCSDKAFRDAHLNDLLKSYVDEFNRNLSDKEPKLSLEALQAEMAECRLFGVLLAATMRPTNFLEGSWVAANDGEINQEVVDSFIEGLPVETLLKNFREDQLYKNGVKTLVEELLCELNKSQH